MKQENETSPAKKNAKISTGGQEKQLNRPPAIKNTKRLGKVTPKEGGRNKESNIQ